MPASPNRIPSPGTAVKSRREELTSGGRIVTPPPRNAEMYFTIDSVLPEYDVSTAAMNSSG